MQTNFEGIWISIVTPYRGDEIDHDALARLSRHLAEEGVSGLVAGATTGDGARLRPGELEAIFSTLRETVPATPIVLGVLQAATETAVAQARSLANLSPEGLIATAPTHGAPTQQDVLRHFEAIVEAADLPVLVYNNPHRTGVSIELETIQALTRDTRVAGVKEGEVSDERIRYLVNETPLRVLCGDDRHNFEALCLGAHGVVSASAHMLTRWYVRMRDLIGEGRIIEARRIAETLQPLILDLSAKPNPALLKVALAAEGWCSPSLRPAFSEVTAHESDRVAYGPAFVRRRTLEPSNLSLAEYASRLRRRELTAVELIETCTQNYTRTENRLNAYKTWDGDRARVIAGAVDILLEQGLDLGPLMGLPVSVKDLFGVPGLPVFAGSDDRLPEAWQVAGPIVSQLQRQLGIVVGKTHTVEFALGGLGVNAHWGTPFNPWSPDEHRVPGGSSSGAGVSLVQGSALLALGTDTAGSVRVPASMTGQVGLKTTYGRWSLDGIVPLSSSLDTPGLLTRTVEDLAFAFTAIDADCKALPTHGPVQLRGLRLGIPENYFWDDIDPSIAAVVETTIELLSQAGAQVVRLKLPYCEEAYEIFYKGGLAASELAAYLDQHFPHKIERLDPVVRARVNSAEQTTSVEYLRRKSVLKRCAERATQVFSDVDVLLSPTVPITPPRLADIGDVTTYGPANLMSMRNTVIANLFGWCALTMPVGLDANRMPVGLQLMAPPRAEERLIEIALGIESLIGKSFDVLGTTDL